MSPTHKIDNQDHMVIMSQLYPAVYTQLVPQQGDAVTKPRRRRRKNKGGGGENGGSGSRKRKLSEEQVSMLEKNFGNERKLESERKDKLALELGLDPRQVAVWFQNRRARWKNKKLEEEYSMLKSTNESIVVEKCQLESEVFKLKEKLCEAEKEIQRLSILSMVCADRINISSESPSSSVLSMETIEPPFLGEFGEFGMVDAYDQDPFYMTADQANNYVNHGMDQWVNLYN